MIESIIFLKAFWSLALLITVSCVDWLTESRNQWNLMTSKTTFCFMVILVWACSREPANQLVNQKYLPGFWATYEIERSDGTIFLTPLNGYSVFGFYAESIQLSRNGEYFPAVWNSDSSHFIYTPGGKYKLFNNEKEIVLSGGQWDMDCEIILFTSEEMWLKTANFSSLKLKRKIRL